MARARNLKPSFFKNEKLVARSFPARLLYEGLWCLADRRGVLKDKPQWIKMEIFPADAVDVDALLSELATLRPDEERPLVVRYELAGKKCVWIVGFDEHNRPHPKEHPNDLPDPPPLGSTPPAAPCAEVVASNGVDIQAGKKHGEPEKEPASCALSPFPLPPSPLPHTAAPQRPRSRKVAGELPPIPDKLRTPAFEEAWTRWQAHRKEIGAPLKPTMAAAQFAEFEAIGVTKSIARINYTIGRGWQGLRDPDPQKTFTPQPRMSTAQDVEAQRKKMQEFDRRQRDAEDRRSRLRLVHDKTPEERERIRQLVIAAAPPELKTMLSKADWQSHSESGRRLLDLMYGQVISDQLAEVA